MESSNRRRAKRNRLGSEKDGAGLDMSSLIDVSFLLLIYFVATSTIAPKESDLSLAMGGGLVRNGSVAEIDPMDILVDRTGAIYVNDEAVEDANSGRRLYNLIRRLSDYADSARVTNLKPLVKIEAEDGSNSQRLVDVLNALADKTVQINDIAFVE